MITQTLLNELYDAEVVDQAGERVGPLERIYLDNRTGNPAWISVRTRILGGRRIVPLANAELVGSQVQVPYPLEMIRDAPQVPDGQHLQEGQERQLYDYYAVTEGPAPSG